MQLEIYSPEARLYEGEVTQVNFPGTSGSFSVLKNHAPIISSLQSGTIVLDEKGGERKQIEIKGGVVEVLKNRLIVLSD